MICLALLGVGGSMKHLIYLIFVFLTLQPFYYSYQWPSGPLSSPPFSTLARPEHFIFETSNVWRGPRKRRAEKSFASVGRTASPTTRSPFGHLSPVSRLPYFNTYHPVWRTRHRKDATRRPKTMLQGSVVEDIPDTNHQPWDLEKRCCKFLA